MSVFNLPVELLVHIFRYVIGQHYFIKDKRFDKYRYYKVQNAITLLNVNFYFRSIMTEYLCDYYSDAILLNANEINYPFIEGSMEYIYLNNDRIDWYNIKDFSVKVLEIGPLHSYPEYKKIKDIKILIIDGCCNELSSNICSSVEEIYLKISCITDKYNLIGFIRNHPNLKKMVIYDRPNYFKYHKGSIFNKYPNINIKFIAWNDKRQKFEK